jgi:hypothetical protein
MAEQAIRIRLGNPAPRRGLQSSIRADGLKIDSQLEALGSRPGAFGRWAILVKRGCYLCSIPDSTPSQGPTQQHSKLEGNEIRAYKIRRRPESMVLVFGVTFIIALVFNGLWVVTHDKIDGGVLVLCSVVGGLVGWALAILATPTDEKEKLQFNAFAKVIAGFWSGFLIVKLNDVFSVRGFKAFLNKDDNLQMEICVRLHNRIFPHRIDMHYSCAHVRPDRRE